MVYNLDEIDIKILRKAYFLKDDESQKIWEWTTELFPTETSDLERKKNYIKIQRHIKRMSDIFSVEGKDDPDFILDQDKIIFQKKKLPNGIKDCMMIQHNGRWTLFEL